MVLIGLGLGPGLDSAALAREQTPPPPGGVAEALPNPMHLFGRLTERYRRLSSYEDQVRVIEIIEREGQSPQRVETRIDCRLEGDELHVETPGAQVARGSGLGGSISRSPAMESLVLRYNLWQAPHMALRFLDEPLRDFRAGVPAGFEVHSAHKLVQDDRELVRFELREPAAEDVARPAVFVLIVDAETMLIERIAGAQTMPDGARLTLHLEIEVVRSDET